VHGSVSYSNLVYHGNTFHYRHSAPAPKAHCDDYR
jgi:hypothetical protein